MLNANKIKYGILHNHIEHTLYEIMVLLFAHCSI